MTLAIDENVIIFLSRGIELCALNLLCHSAPKNTSMVSLVPWGKKEEKHPKTHVKPRKE